MDANHTLSGREIGSYHTPTGERKTNSTRNVSRSPMFQASHRIASHRTCSIVLVGATSGTQYAWSSEADNQEAVWWGKVSGRRALRAWGRDDAHTCKASFSCTFSVFCTRGSVFCVVRVLFRLWLRG